LWFSSSYQRRCALWLYLGTVARGRAISHEGDRRGIPAVEYNAIERAVVLRQDDTIRPEDLPETLL
jgi:hypothetical protein